MNCKDCTYWFKSNDGTDGDCLCRKLGFNAIDDRVPSSDGLWFHDEDKWGESFSTGPDFGCVHFNETRKLTREEYNKATDEAITRTLNKFGFHPPKYRAVSVDEAYDKVVKFHTPKLVDDVATDYVLNWNFQQYEPEDEVVFNVLEDGNSNRWAHDWDRVGNAWKDRFKDVPKKVHAVLIKVKCPRKYKDPHWVLNKIIQEHTVAPDIDMGVARVHKGCRLLPLHDLITGEEYGNLKKFEDRIRVVMREAIENGAEGISYDLWPVSTD